MRFWDTSAVLPLLVVEETTSKLKEVLTDNENMVVWWGTQVESASALARSLRAQTIEEQAYDNGMRALDVLRKHWNEIAADDEVRRQALRVVRVHPLRAADALQLAAAIVWAGRYDGREFVSLDDRLRTAARAEGFSIVP